ncbi:unnamed protein product [Camellia sinensis]
MSRDLGHLSKAVYNQLYKRLKTSEVARTIYRASPNGKIMSEKSIEVPKARSVEIQKEDPNNVDRLCERLQREISQMRRRLSHDMQLYIVKKDAQKKKTEPNDAAIKGIMEDPELVSDAELSDYSDSEPPTDLSVN